MDFRAEVERIVERHKWVMIHNGEDLMPSCLVFGPNWERAPVPLPWSSARMKELMLQALAETMRDGHARAYIIWSEAWVATRSATSDPDPGSPGFVMPRDDPNRREVVVTIGVERGKAPLGIALAIIRDEAGKVIELRPEEAGQLLFGRLASLLPEEGRPN